MHLFFILLSAGFLAAVAVAGAADRIPEWVAPVYWGMSLVTAFVYAWDKRRARRAGWRTAEKTLHTCELLGGWPGALVAQRVFRHKTAKRSFQLIFWLIVLGHLAAWAWWLGPR